MSIKQFQRITKRFKIPANRCQKSAETMSSPRMATFLPSMADFSPVEADFPPVEADFPPGEADFFPGT